MIALQPLTTGDDRRTQRRWLIGLAITIIFGLFGAVMAVLAYGRDTQPTMQRPAETGAPSVRPAAPSQPPGRDKSRHDNGRGNGK